jgi:hypothetical protein
MLSDVTILGALVVEGYKMRRLAHHVSPSVCMQYHRSGTTARVPSDFFVDDRRLAFCHVYKIRLDPSMEAVISEIHALSIVFGFFKFFDNIFCSQLPPFHFLSPRPSRHSQS